MDQHDDPPVDNSQESRPTALEELKETEAEFHAAQAEAAAQEKPLLPESEPLRSIFKALGTLEQIVGSLLLVMILILVLTQVVLRYVPGAAPWTGELARLSMVWLAFLLAGYLIAYPPHHIAIKVVDFVAKGRWLAGVKLFVNLVILGTCSVLIYGSYTLVTTGVDQVTPAGGLSLRFVNAIPLVGLILVAIRVILAIAIRDIPALIRGEEEPA